MILQVLAQIKVQSVLLLEFAVVYELENAAAFGQVVRQVHALQYLLLVEALERDHHVKCAEFEAVLELVGFSWKVRNGWAQDLVRVLHRSFFSDGVVVKLTVIVWAEATEIRSITTWLRLTVHVCVLVATFLNTLHLRLFFLRNDKQIRKLLEELVLRLTLEAIFQVFIKHLHDLNNYIFLILINLRCLRLLTSILLIFINLFFPFFESPLILILLVIHFVLHQVVDSDQLVNLEVLFAMAHLLLIHLRVIVPCVYEITEELDRLARLHGRVKVIDGVQAKIVARRLLGHLFILLVLAVHFVHRVIECNNSNGSVS